MYVPLTWKRSDRSLRNLNMTLSISFYRLYWKILPTRDKVCPYPDFLVTLEPRFSTASLEPAILSRTALDGEQTPFHYLLGAWKRAVEMAREIRTDRDPQAKQKLKILAEIRRLCISYAGLSLMMPEEMFGFIYVSYNANQRDAPRESDLCSYLMQDIYNEVKLPEEFLNELAKRFHEDGLIDVIGSTITGIAEEISSVKFNQSQRSVALRVHLFWEI
jgi:hypothetical protein